MIQFVDLILVAGLWQNLAPMFPVLFALVVMVGAALAVVMSLRAAKKRTQQFALTAAQLSLQFDPPSARGIVERLEHLPLMQKGSGRQPMNTIVAETEQLRLTVFDYQYTTGSGKSKSTHHQSVAWVSSRQLKMPEFVLYPETWMNRLGDKLLKEDIDFEDDPEFSQKYVLTGPDKTAVQEFFDARRRKALQEIQQIPTVEGSRNDLLFYRPSTRIAPAELKGLMSEAFSLYQAFASEAVA